MKKIINSLILTGMVSMGFAGTIACDKVGETNGKTNETSVLQIAEDGTTTLIEESLKAALIETAPIDDSETDILLAMKEEEKLARDVYTALYKKWKVPIFNNISSAENNHMNAVNYLLKKYGASDTLISAEGIFQEAETQALYAELVEKGSVSITEAFLVGALIEDMDIYDLQESISKVSNENIIMVFKNLMRGSGNHMRAFNRQLKARGVVYTPVYISADEFNTIINSGWQTGI